MYGDTDCINHFCVRLPCSGIFSGWLSHGAKFRKKYEYAAKSYSSCLGILIRKAKSAPEEMIEINSRAIVKMRNDFRHALSNLSEHLNSEIDKLEKLLKQPESAD